MLKLLTRRNVQRPAIPILVAAWIWLSSPPLAPAAPITFTYTGEVTGVRDDGPYLDGSITVGTPFWGTYTFESSTPDDYPNDPRARYTFPASQALVMTLRIGSYDLLAPLDFIFVDNAQKDGYRVQSSPFPLGVKLADLNFSYIDLSAGVFDSDALPTEPPDISRFNNFGGFTFASVDQVGDSFAVGGEITSITPEPQTAILGILGLCCSLLRRKAA